MAKENEKGKENNNARQDRERNDREREREFSGRGGVLAGCNDVLQEHD